MTSGKTKSGIYYEIYNTHSKDLPLVLIMGLGMDLRGWMFQVPEFSKHFKTVVIDNRGVGKSIKPIPPYSTEQMAEDVIEVMDNVGIKKANIVGASMGGMITQIIAINHPERIEKAVLACTLAKLSDFEMDLVKRGLKMIKGLEFSEELMKNFSLFLDMNPDAIFDFLSKYLLSEKFLKSNYELFKEFIKQYIQDGFSVQGFVGQLYAVINHNTENEIEKIKSKTLVISGGNDIMVTPEHSKYLSSKIKDSKLVILEGGSHAFMFEMANEFNTEVLRFLKS